MSEKGSTKRDNSSLLAAVVFLTLLLSGCASTPQSLELFNQTSSLPLKVELTQTPFFPQKKYQCGPAALATSINFHKTLTSPDQLKPLLYIPELGGSLQVEFPSAAKRFGFLAIEQDGKLETLLQEIAHGNPVLVMQNLGLDWFPYWHYAVVIGYDLDSQSIILRSGQDKRLVRPITVFERTWQRAEHWSLVVVPDNTIPLTATEERFTEAAVLLDSTTAYQTGLSRWPENYVLWFGLGNRHYQQADYKASEQAFRQATRLQPERAEAWNNLAYVLVELGRHDESMAAIQQALTLQPENDNYIESLHDIRNRIKGGQSIK